MSETDFDAIIIGSGFGGSVMAYRLAEANLRVCVLERGKAYPPNSFPRAPFKMRNNFWDPSAGLYGLFNVWSFRGSGSLVSSGLGGGSLVYANVIIRKDEKWFVTENGPDGSYKPWPITRADLEPHYDRVGEMLNIQRYPLDHPNLTPPPKTLAMIDAARRLKENEPGIDAEWRPLNLAVSFRQNPVRDPNAPDDNDNPPVVGEPIIEAHANYHGRTRLTCIQCGECDLGCNTGSKNTLDYNYLTEANRLGAEIRPLCEVKSFAPLDGRKGYSVTYLQHEPDKWEGRPVEVIKKEHPEWFPTTTITAKRVIISAGAYGSPFLLFKNREHLPGLSTKLGSRFSVNGDLLSFLVKSKQGPEKKSLPRIIDPSFGPVITSAIRIGDTLDGNGEQGRGFYVEDGGHPYLLGWAAESIGWMGYLRRFLRFGKLFLKYRIGVNPDADLGKELSELIGDCNVSKSTMTLLTMGRDNANGNLSYEEDHLNCDWTQKKSQEYFDRVGRVLRSIAGSLNARYMDNPSYRYLHQVITAHPLGGCPMGQNEDDGVVDAYGEVFNYPGLYVMDGSIMPGPVGPNPSMTIAAISDRAATHIIRQHKGVQS